MAGLEHERNEAGRHASAVSLLRVLPCDEGRGEGGGKVEVVTIR